MSTPTQSGARALLILSTMAMTSYFLAEGVTGLVGSAVLGMGDEEVVADAAPVATAEPERVDPLRILQRNIFDSERGPLTQPPAEPPCEGDDCPEEVVECPEGPEGAECRGEVVDPNAIPVCDGSLRLVAAVYRPRRPEWSFASIIGAAGHSLLYRTGESVDERRVLGIYPEEVHLQPAGGGRCRLALFSDEEGMAASPMRPTPMGATVMVTMATAEQTMNANERARADNAGIEAEELESGIRRSSDTQFTVSRSLVDQVLENQGQLMRTARVIPHEENGRVVGVKLYGIRRSSLLGRLGVQNGDMLRTINGYSLTSPDTALEAYTRLRSADHLTLSVVRRGQSMTLDYTIE